MADPQRKLPGHLRAVATPRRMLILVPILFGLLSVVLGADANWDLYNYHLYAPFALLNGKLDIDLAPAGFQGYFNPLLDVPLYLLNTHVPAIITAFLMGLLHGLSIVALFGIARAALADASRQGGDHLALLLALAGCLTPNFLTGIGNGMGDNTTALLILAGIWLLLAHWATLGAWTIRAVGTVVAAGLLVGLAVGLKLTNAVSAVAICLALLACYSATFPVRFRAAFLFGIGVLVGIAATGGYWMLEMGQRFGNPFFPQFGSIFPNELANPFLVADTRWLPRGIVEYLLWPFVFAADSFRVGELSITQILWPAAYLLFVAYGIIWIWRRVTGRSMPKLDPRATFVLVFVVLAYLVWMRLFSIFRYTVAFEMLLPLCLFLLLAQLVPEHVARRWSLRFLALATVVMVIGGVPNWGHEGFTHPLYHTELPKIAEPERETVLIAFAPEKRALGWLVAKFPASLSFIGIENSFPASDAYRMRAREMAQTRGGAIHALISAETSERAHRFAGYNRTANWLGLTNSADSCAFLKAAVERLRLRASIDPGEGTAVCRIGVRPQDAVDIATENASLAERARSMLERNGFTLDPASCVAYASGIGTARDGFQFCSATVLDDTASAAPTQPKR
ncbi:MAG: hypothetical protein ACOH2J_18985 [Allorhizobium sp.]